MGEQREFRGIWIPKEIWLEKNLTLQQKVFLVEIDSLDGEDGCYATNEYFAEFFGLSAKRVSVVINSLVEAGLVESQINKERGNKRILKISDRYPRKQGYPIPESKDTLSPESSTYILSDNKTDNREKRGGTSRFLPPTVEQVREYCTERINNVDAERFVDHYESNGWMVGKTKMKNWRAAVRTWEKTDASKFGTKPNEAFVPRVHHNDLGFLEGAK